MKKILLVLALLFIVNISCKKMIDGGGLCACSPTNAPYLSLVIRNNNGLDLLNPASAGYLDKSKGDIELYTKDINGLKKEVSFYIRPPFTYGKDQFAFYQFYSNNITQQAKSVDQSFFLKLGDKIIELNLKINDYTTEALFANKKETPMVYPSTSNFDYVNTIFDLKLP